MAICWCMAAELVRSGWAEAAEATAGAAAVGGAEAGGVVVVVDVSS